MELCQSMEKKRLAYGDTTINVGRKEGTYAGICSTAEGQNTTASNACSHAEGSVTVASGVCSHAEGVGTVASGVYSHSEGDGTTASGVRSHAGGGDSVASGDSSFAHGKTVKDAVEDANSKELRNIPIEDRIKKFIEVFGYLD